MTAAHVSTSKDLWTVGAHVCMCFLGRRRCVGPALDAC